MSDNKYSYKTINGMKKRIHRHIMEDLLGRDLDKNEYVYHINGNPNDNDINNLIVIKKNMNKWKNEIENGI